MFRRKKYYLPSSVGAVLSAEMSPSRQNLLELKLSAVCDFIMDEEGVLVSWEIVATAPNNTGILILTHMNANKCM